MPEQFNQSKEEKTGEKSSNTNNTNHYSTPQMPEQFNQSKEEKTEDEDVRITDNEIIIKGGKYKFEIYYGYAGPIEDHTKIIDLKIPQLPQWRLVAKKKDETLDLLITVDFFQNEGKTIYYIRDKKEIIEKLYRFKGERHISQRLINDALDSWLGHINPEKHIEWVDVRDVVAKYEEWGEINQDPLNFFLNRANTIVGNEKLKVAVLLSVVSTSSLPNDSFVILVNFKTM